MEKPKLRTNVISHGYTFLVTFYGRKSQEIRVEAESIDAAVLKLPADRMRARLLREDTWEVAENE